MTWLLATIRTKAGRYVTLAVVALAAVFGAKWRWQSNAVTRDRREQEIKAHDRINDADIGIGATDDERRKRLREMGDEWIGR